MATLQELAAMSDWQTYFAQQESERHGARVPLLTSKQREALVEFTFTLNKIDPKLSSLYTQHLAVMSDCLADCRKDLRAAHTREMVFMLVVVFAFCAGLAVAP